jgi:hypothetical protein
MWQRHSTTLQQRRRKKQADSRTPSASSTIDESGYFARGINSFQLLKDGDRYWVVTIFWDSESPAKPIPAKYLP